MRRRHFIHLATVTLALASCSSPASYGTVTALGEPHRVGPDCPVAHVHVASTEMVGFVRMYFVPDPQADQAIGDVTGAGGAMGRWALYSAPPIEVAPDLTPDATLALPSAWCAQGGAAFVAVDPLHPGSADITFKWDQD